MYIAIQANYVKQEIHMQNDLNVYIVFFDENISETLFIGSD